MGWERKKTKVEGKGVWRRIIESGADTAEVWGRDGGKISRHVGRKGEEGMQKKKRKERERTEKTNRKAFRELTSLITWDVWKISANQ